MQADHLQGLFFLLLCVCPGISSARACQQTEEVLTSPRQKIEKGHPASTPLRIAIVICITSIRLGLINVDTDPPYIPLVPVESIIVALMIASAIIANSVLSLLEQHTATWIENTSMIIILSTLLFLIDSIKSLPNFITILIGIAPGTVIGIFFSSIIFASFTVTTKAIILLQKAIAFNLPLESNISKERKKTSSHPKQARCL